MDKNLSVFAEITPKSEFFMDAKKAVQNIVPLTCAEQGCVRFELYTDHAGTKLFLSEIWTDQAALDAHYAEEYTQSVFKSYDKWLAQEPRIIKMQAVE